MDDVPKLSITSSEWQNDRPNWSEDVVLLDLQASTLMLDPINMYRDEISLSQAKDPTGDEEKPNKSSSAVVSHERKSECCAAHWYNAQPVWDLSVVRWVVGSILHGVDPLSYFSFQSMLHGQCNKGRGMCYPVCGMMHIKEPLLLIGKSSLCGGSGFPFSYLSGPLPYVWRHITVNKMCWVRR